MKPKHETDDQVNLPWPQLGDEATNVLSLLIEEQLIGIG